MLFQEGKEKLKIFSIPIRIRIHEAPMLFQEEKEKFKIFSSRIGIRIHEASMLFYEEKEKFKIFSIGIRIRILLASMLIFEKSKSLKIFKFEFKLRRVAQDETKNTGHTEGASFRKRGAQGEGDGLEAEAVENDTEAPEEQSSVKVTILRERQSVASPC